MSPPMKYTDEMREWLAANIRGRGFEELTGMFNSRFQTAVTKKNLNQICWRMGLWNGRKREHRYTPEQYEWIRNNIAGRMYAETAERFNERFGASVTANAIKNLCVRFGWSNGMKGRCEANRRNQFRLGNKPWNTGTKGATGANGGSFRPGHQLHTKPLGAMVMRDDGRLYVKTAQPNVWRLAAHVESERVNGPLPPNAVVLCANGDESDLSPDNLLAMSRAEYTCLYKNGLRQPDADLTRAGLMLARLRLKVNERMKEAKE